MKREVGMWGQQANLFSVWHAEDGASGCVVLGLLGNASQGTMNGR
jgi:hypothetical protein